MKKKKTTIKYTPICNHSHMQNTCKVCENFVPTHAIDGAQLRVANRVKLYFSEVGSNNLECFGTSPSSSYSLCTNSMNKHQGFALSEEGAGNYASDCESIGAAASRYRKRIPWELAYQHLKAFHQKHGDLSVPQNFYTSDGIRLGLWIRNQRNYLSQQTKRGKLDAQNRLRIEKLEALGIQFDKTSHGDEVRQFDWEKMIQQLASFKKFHGHTRVHRTLDFDNDLAVWAAQQRQEYRTLLCGQPSRLLNRNQVGQLRQIGFEFDSSSSSENDDDHDDMVDESTPESSPVEPPLLEEDESSVSFRTQESMYMAKLDHRIYVEEEKAFMKHLDSEIRSSEIASENESQEKLTNKCIPMPESRHQVLQTIQDGNIDEIPKSRNRYVATMVVPRYLKWSTPKISKTLDTEVELQRILDRVTTPSLKLRIEKIPEDTESLRIVGEGEDKAALVESGELIDMWFAGFIFEGNYSFLTEWGTKVELELDSAKKLGSTVAQASLGKGPLILYGADETGQLATSLGIAVMEMGAAIVGIDDDEACRDWTIKLFKEELAKRAGKKYKLSLHVHPDCDLSHVDPSVTIQRASRKRKLSATADDPSASGGSSLSTCTLDLSNSSAVDGQKLAQEDDPIGDTVIESSNVNDVRELSQPVISHHYSAHCTAVDSTTGKISREDHMTDSIPRKASMQSETTNDVSKPIRSLVEDSESHPTQNAAEESRDIPALASYNVFKGKFSTLVEMDLKPNGIDLDFAIGQMWKQHEIKFGRECGEKCRCARELPFLTKQIGSGLLNNNSGQLNTKHMTGENQSTYADYWYGLTGTFASKFLPKLVEEYPEDSDHDLLLRLVNIWTLHRHGNDFGLTCVSGCKGESGWDFTFRQGMSGGEQGLPVAKDQIELASDSSNTVPVSITVMQTDPQKSSFLTRDQHGDGMIPRKEARDTANVEQDFGAIPRKKAKPQVTENKFLPKNSSQSERKVYEIEFDAQQPLGFYTITDKNGSSTECKIVSVFPHGQRSDDLRLQEGTLIVGARTDDFELEVKDHQGLRVAYEMARKKELSLSLRFLNSKIEFKGGLGMPRARSNSWTSAGRYRGQHSEGWNGDGRNVISESRVPISTSNTSDCEQVQNPMNNPSKTNPAVQESSNGWIVVDKLRPLRANATVSCLKQSSTRVRRENRSVQFSSTFDMRFYEKGSKTSRFRVKATSVSELVENSNASSIKMDPESGQPNQTFSDTILDSSLKDCLQMLENGALNSAGLQDPETLLRPLKQLIVDLKEKLQKKPHDEMVSNLMDEALLKEKLLKLYVHAFHTARLAKSIKNWLRFEVCITEVDRLTLTPLLKGKESPLLSVSVSAMFETVSDLQPLQPLPNSAFANTVDFKDSGVSYLVNYNPVVARDRSLRVELEHLSGNQSVHLGDIVIHLDTVKKRCPYVNDWQELSFEAEQNPFLASAIVRVRCRRVRIEQQHVEKKRRDACNRLNGLVDWVKRLNQDLAARDQLLSLLPQVPVSCGITLLHSAIFLREINLVQRLLDLGADPLVKSVIGSPLSLAQNIAECGMQLSISPGEDRRKENHENSSEGSRHYRTREAEKIFELLSDHVQTKKSLETSGSLSDSE